MTTAIAAIFIFLFVILFHEFGHFITAKAVGIKVNEFSIGMGPKLFQKDKGETKYTLRLLPIGGYVSMEGEDEDSDDPRGFSKASPVARILVVAAGAIMNFILAIIAFTIVSFSVGTATTTVENTIDNSPAYVAGITSGEEIVSINNESVTDWNDIADKIGKNKAGEEITIETKKDGEAKEYNLKTEEAEDGRSIIGIEPRRERGFLNSIKEGFIQTFLMIKAMFQVIGMLFRGELGKEAFSGPVGVISAIGDAARQGFMMVLYFTGFISVNLGFFNLLPIPALDGSRIIFTLVEIVRGKPIDPEKEGMVHFIGFILLIGLMIFVTYSDIIKMM